MFPKCNEPTKLPRNIEGRNAMLLLTSLYLRSIDASKWGIWPNMFVTLRKLLWPTPTKHNVCKDDAILESTHLKMCTKGGQCVWALLQTAAPGQEEKCQGHTWQQNLKEPQEKCPGQQAHWRTQLSYKVALQHKKGGNCRDPASIPRLEFALPCVHCYCQPTH